MNEHPTYVQPRGTRARKARRESIGLTMTVTAAILLFAILMILGFVNGLQGGWFVLPF